MVGYLGRQKRELGDVQRLVKSLDGMGKKSLDELRKGTAEVSDGSIALGIEYSREIVLGDMIRFEI